MLILPLLLVAFVTTLGAQDLSCLSVDDVKVVRQMLADREFFKKRAEDAEAQLAAAVISRDNWKGLYESEKKRADEIQGERIKILTDQAIADRQKIGELNAQVISLKSSRKWWFGAGVVSGGFGGYYIGKNQNRIVQAVAPQQSAVQFGTSLKF
jgi:hypothetical protein